MRLFAVGRRYRGEADVIVEAGGVRRNLTHEARVLAARAEQDRVTECRDTLALNARDVDEMGIFDPMEQGRV